jgi:hypothetical protein
MSKKVSFLFVVSLLVIGGIGLSTAVAERGAAQKAKAGPTSLGPEGEWSLNATYIEACSCHLFCPCYFNPHPEHPYCEFNMAVKINDGHYGTTSLKGVKYWLTGDLGDNFGDGKTPWLIVTFHPDSTPAQREALGKILSKVYPVAWDKLQSDESDFTWEITGTQARAKLANGKGEMVLDRFKGNDGGKVVLHNVNYFGAESNDGFIMYKSKVHRYDGFGHKFEYSGRNAFVITIHSKGKVEAGD